jgi:hypothetical protein
VAEAAQLLECLVDGQHGEVGVVDTQHMPGDRGRELLGADDPGPRVAGGGQTEQQIGGAPETPVAGHPNGGQHTGAGLRVPRTGALMGEPEILLRQQPRHFRVVERIFGSRALDSQPPPFDLADPQSAGGAGGVVTRRREGVDDVD